MFHNVSFSPKVVPFKRQCGKYCTAGQATNDNMVHAHCMLDNEVYKHRFRICNTYSFSISTMTARRRRGVTLCLHCFSCFFFNFNDHT